MANHLSYANQLYNLAKFIEVVLNIYMKIGGTTMLASFFPWILYLLAWFCTLIAVNNGAVLSESLLLYVVIFNGGIQGLWAAIGHLVFPQETAKKIGWLSNGFQTEIGATNLAIGTAGTLTFFYNVWAIPVGLILAIFLSGCVYIHIKDRIANNNNAPCNSGPMLYSSIAIVITIIACLIIRI